MTQGVVREVIAVMMCAGDGVCACCPVEKSPREAETQTGGTYVLASASEGSANVRRFTVPKVWAP